MKISFVEPHLKLYGGIRRIIELANRLYEKGHDVTIFHSDGSDCKWMKCNAKIKNYKDVLKETHDVLIYNDPNAIDYSLVKKAKAKLKIFYVLALYERHLLKRNSFKLYFSNKRIFHLKKSLYSPYLKLSNSTWIYHWLKNNLNIDSKLLIGGINTELFHPVKVKKNPNKICILCSGNPRERKGIKTIIEAVEKVKKKEPRVILDTYYGKRIPQEKMAEKYCSADIFVDGQWYAGWNNPVAEAMACKVPVVCTDIGGIKDFAFNNKTALLVPPKDPEAMASAIFTLIKDKDLQETLRKNAYSHIRQFSWDKSIERLEEILKFELNRRDKKHSKISIIIHMVCVTVYRPYKLIKVIKTVLNNFIYRNKYFDKYEKLGAYHWDSYIIDSIYKKHVNYIIKSFKRKPKGNILDIGCGDGFISCFLAKIGFSVKGIDIEKTGIKLAQEKCPFVSFEVEDLLRVSKQYDYLLASEVIEHLPNPDEFLLKINRILKKEALITTPKKNYYKQPDPYHIREYNIYEFEKLLKKYFRIFQIESSEEHLYAWISSSK